MLLKSSTYANPSWKVLEINFSNLCYNFIKELAHITTIRFIINVLEIADHSPRASRAKRDLVVKLEVAVDLSSSC